jgi:NTP pyrophosphatase (non-canonical NTP hydrolase)
MKDGDTAPCDELMALRAAVRAYVSARMKGTKKLRAQLETELGELLVELVSMADQLNLDLSREAGKGSSRPRKPK